MLGLHPAAREATKRWEPERFAAVGAALRERHGGTLVVLGGRDERALAVITLVNDNMPFLFDSVMGEINEVLPEPALVLHPVIYVRHSAGGVAEIYGESGTSRGASTAKP